MHLKVGIESGTSKPRLFIYSEFQKIHDRGFNAFFMLNCTPLPICMIDVPLFFKMMAETISWFPAGFQIPYFHPIPHERLGRNKVFNLKGE